MRASGKNSPIFWNWTHKNIRDWQHSANFKKSLKKYYITPPYCISPLFRVQLVERDHTPLGLPLVDPDRSGKTTQYDFGTVIFDR